MFSYPQYTLLLRKNQSRFPFEKRLSETDDETLSDGTDNIRILRKQGFRNFN